MDAETEREKLIRIFKYNSSKLLHERNKYVFMASVAEDAISFNCKLSEFIGYILIKKLFKMICNIKHCLDMKKNEYSLEAWGDYVESKDFKKICNYINKEFELFKNYYENLNSSIIQKIESLEYKGNNFSLVVKCDNEDELDYYLQNFMKEYLDCLMGTEESKSKSKEKDIYIHINQLLDSINAKRIFLFTPDTQNQFNFKNFYEEVKQMTVIELREMIRSKLSELGIVTALFK